MISFKEYLQKKSTITEGYEEKLQTSLIQEINKELFEYVKLADPEKRVNPFIERIINIFDAYDIILLGRDGRQFKGNIVESDTRNSFQIAPRSVEDDRGEFEAYSNVLLYVSWVEKNGQFILKDASLRDKIK